MSVIYQMLSLYNSVAEDNIFHSILQNMFKDLRHLPEKSIEAVAADCFTSPSSISRLVKALGFRNFTEFKYALSNVIKTYGFENRLSPSELGAGARPAEGYLNAVNATVQFFLERFDTAQTDRVVSMILAHRTVYILYCGNGKANIHPLQCELVMSGRNAPYSSDPEFIRSHLSQMGPDDMLLLVLESSNDGYEAASHLLPVIHARGAGIAIVASSANPLFGSVDAATVLYPRDLTLNSFLYCYLILNLITVQFRHICIDLPGLQSPK